MAFIILLFIVLPFVELTLLLRIGAQIGALNTIGIVIATGIIGGYLAKREGLAVWQRFQSKMSTGSLPGEELLDGVIVLAAGALLITPGVLTDAIGLLGLFPPSRLILKAQLKKRIQVKSAFTQTRPGVPNPPAPDSDSPARVDITQIVEKRTGNATD